MVNVLFILLIFFYFFIHFFIYLFYIYILYFFFLFFLDYHGKLPNGTFTLSEPCTRVSRFSTPCVKCECQRNKRWKCTYMCDEEEEDEELRKKREVEKIQESLERRTESIRHSIRYLGSAISHLKSVKKVKRSLLQKIRNVRIELQQLVGRDD